MAARESGTPLSSTAVRDALLLVDVIQDFRHEDGERLLASFRRRHAALTPTTEGTRS